MKESSLVEKWSLAISTQQKNKLWFSNQSNKTKICKDVLYVFTYYVINYVLIYLRLRFINNMFLYLVYFMDRYT